jgi:flagellar biosynthesis/type III secretory pathway protein FliH
MIGRARIVRGSDLGSAATVSVVSQDLLGSPKNHGARVVPKTLAEAHEEAQAIRARATDEAEALVEAARAEAQAMRERLATEVRESETAKLAATYLAMRAEDEARAEREIDRTVALAVLLAERIVGEAVAADPGRLRGLAEDALREARGARKVSLDAHPSDAEALRRVLGELGADAFTVRENPELSRGSLTVYTELGTIDARLRPQLERLAGAIRSSLRR